MPGLRIRFSSFQYSVNASGNINAERSEAIPASAPSARTAPGTRRATAKSHLGCRQCKLRRVKCDETFPTCLRCQRRGFPCESNALSEPWRVEARWLAHALLEHSLMPSSRLSQVAGVNQRLILLWLEISNRLIVLEGKENPLALPLIDHLTKAPAAIHAIQSISAGHEHFFDKSKIEFSLEERSKSMLALVHQLKNGTTPVTLLLLATWLLGSSSSYFDHHVHDIGQEHLFASRTMVQMLISDDQYRSTPLAYYLVGMYVYWDMACSTLTELGEAGLSTETSYAVADFLCTYGLEPHPTFGSQTRLFVLLGNIGRYCKSVVDDGFRNEALEALFEESLLLWQVPDGEGYWGPTVDAFVKHGMIMLNRFCGRDVLLTADGAQYDHQPGRGSSAMACQSTIILAREAVRDCLRVPDASSFISLQPIPLLSAAAELTSEDLELRGLAVRRFKTLFSYNRLPAHLYAIELLEDVWRHNDSGAQMSWLEMMALKKWRLRAG